MQITRTAPRLGIAALACVSGTALAADPDLLLPAMAAHWSGYLALATFLLAILLVSLEEFTQFSKSKPVMISAGVIWALIGWYAVTTGSAAQAEQSVRQSLLQYSELMLLILVVMTYINALGERRVFKTLRARLCNRGLSYRGLFWSSGISTFLLSPFLDNLASALLVGALILVIEPDNRRFISLGCINVVVAANAGGAFSPFGDITTLMVWQQDIQSSNGALDFWSFFNLFIPALISFLIPACAMHLALPKGRLQPHCQPVRMLRGARRIMLLFLGAIATAVLFRGVLHLPAVVGMLTGLSYLQFFGYYLKKTHRPLEEGVEDAEMLASPVPVDGRTPFDVFVRVGQVEWDTLLFIYGVALSVGGLGYIGYMATASDIMYSQWGATAANITVGLASAVLENVPTMYSVLTMMPDMTQGEWLLATLSVGTGGSLLAIGSAAGVALMAQSNGNYTFYSHLKWTPVILLAYFAGILVHLWLNARLF
ncbi:sodium:proton antiporter NhaD [Sedimenticola hydrogenitrophicus]|uniref:sodium:proton antiporter NhaD n=1 Tax=Sedimenticola hydrogenitrophicus TaxID=2967975 RepID=UPI0021A6AEB3|nr:sodium:proton antiporter NhaD [Sedimenticola hydrogenitrophicus]